MIGVEQFGETRDLTSEEEKAYLKGLKSISKATGINLYEKEEPITINIPSIDSWTITDLKYTCRKNKVRGYTKMDREQLIAEVKRIIENYKSK